MSWIHNIWPKRAKAKSKQDLGGALASSFGQDLQSPEELIDRANNRALRGDIEGAIADFDVAIDLNPAKATSFYNRGYLHNLAGHYQQAIQDCSEAISLLPDYDEAFYQRGIAQLELGNLDAAVVDLSEVLRLNPFSIKAYYKRATCYAEKEDIQGAVADYTQAILRVPKDSNAYLQRGLFLTKLKEYRTAIEDFSSALSFNPKSADAYYHRGYCYAELGEQEKATQDFNQAMLYDPSQQAADYNRAYALGFIKTAKNLPSAIDDTPTKLQDHEAVVLSLDPNDATILTTPSSPTPPLADNAQVPPSRRSSSRPQPTPQPSPASTGMLVRQTDVDVLFVQGQQKSGAGDFEGAIEAYSKILEYEPENARAYMERGKSFANLGQVDFAADDMDAAVRCAKQKSLNLIRDYSGTLSETLATLKVDLKASPDHASFSGQGGNQSIEAEIIKYSQEIHRNSLNAGAFFKRAQSRALLGDLQGAIADYTRTISLEPEHRDAYYKRGMLLEALGDEDGATADFNRAIRRTPLLLPSPGHKPQNSDPTSMRPAQPPEAQQVTSSEDGTDVRHEAGGQRPIQPADEFITDELAVESPDRHSEITDSEDQTQIQSPAAPMPRASDPFSGQQRRQTLLQVDETELNEEQTLNTSGMTDEELAEIIEEDSIPTYFSDLVLDPCTHEGNDPNNRFCVHCGQPIPPLTESQS